MLCFKRLWSYSKPCVLVCPDGHYGDKCEKMCGKDAKCNHVTGECCGCTELHMLGIFKNYFSPFNEIPDAPGSCTMFQTLTTI